MSLALLFQLSICHAQIFKGTVTFIGTTAFCELHLQPDSSLVFVRNDAKNNVYEEYYGSIKNFHNDIYVIHTNQSIRREGWGLLDERTGLSCNYSQILIDTIHRKTLAPVTIVYSDGNTENYPFKGQFMLDSNKLNAKHPTYQLKTNHLHPFTGKKLVLSAAQKENICFLNNHSDISFFVRFKKDSLITVPDQPYVHFIYNMRLKQNSWKAAPIKKKKVIEFKTPDISSWRMKGDSLIIEDEMEIESTEDTIYRKIIRQFFKNKFISSREVSKEHGVIDSTLYINVFDSLGQVKKTMSRWFQTLNCDSSLYNGGELNEWQYSGARIAVERITYPCNRYSYTNIEYHKDSIGVMRNVSYNSEYKSLHVQTDSTWYHTNGLKRLTRSYQDSALSYVWKFAYSFDMNGKLTYKSERITHQGGYEVAQLYLCRDTDTLPIKSSTRYHVDSTLGQYITYQYNPDKKISWFKYYDNGRLSSISVQLPPPEGCSHGWMSKSFNADSIEVQNEEGLYCLYKKEKKGTLEMWDTGRDRAYYRTDTIAIASGFEVRTYKSSNYDVYPDFKSVPIAKCRLTSYSKLDSKRRPIYIKEFGENKNEVRKFIRITYSKSE